MAHHIRNKTHRTSTFVLLALAVMSSVSAYAQDIEKRKVAIVQAALEKLQNVPIWVEAQSEVKCVCYHPSEKWLEQHGFNPAKVKRPCSSVVVLAPPRDDLNERRLGTNERTPPIV